MAKHPEITLQQALQGARLALANGESLIDDAMLLLDGGRLPRAIALAILAMEELGKIPRMLQVRRFAADGRMKDWWRYFRDHDAKSGLNALVTTDVEEMKQLPPQWHIEFGEMLDGIKLRALYVDFFDDIFVSPDEIEGMDTLAPRLVRIAAQSLEHHRKHLAGIDPDGFEEKRDQLRKLADELLSDDSVARRYLSQLGDSSEEKRLRFLIESSLAEKRVED